MTNNGLPSIYGVGRKPGCEGEKRSVNKVSNVAQVLITVCAVKLIIFNLNVQFNNHSPQSSMHSVTLIKYSQHASTRGKIENLT